MSSPAGAPWLHHQPGRSDPPSRGGAAPWSLRRPTTSQVGSHADPAFQVILCGAVALFLCKRRSQERHPGGRKRMCGFPGKHRNHRLRFDLCLVRLCGGGGACAERDIKLEHLAFMRGVLVASSLGVRPEVLRIGASLSCLSPFHLARRAAGRCSSF